MVKERCSGCTGQGEGMCTKANFEDEKNIFATEEVA